MGWTAAPIPANETERLAAVKSYHLLDTAPEIAYDEISELAAQICQCPVAVIGLIDETRDWKKSTYGLPPDFRSMPRELSICSATIFGGSLVISPDLTKDERYRDNPTVAGEPNLRFYCGVPLINPQGFALGTICVVDFQPRELTFEQTEAMQRLSHQVVSQFELRRSMLELERRMAELAEARSEAERERERSERLLLNILPRVIADELRTKESVTPRYHESVTVMFADFEGFSRLAERIEPKSLIEQLDQFFSAFDAIAERHRLEKLKTIGDAYMCVGGLPEPNRTHDVDACLAALSLLEFMRRTNGQREKLHLPRWDLRIGIHSGPVMAGVVGKSKFIYDVWGDAVNIAARLEAAGGVGRINVSDVVHNRVRPLMEFEARGAVEVKNKAPINMHYLARIKPEFSRDPEGLRPNDAFHRECERLFPGYRAVG
ncbi:MAG TPA: adenylate/guanylate cyclase domain-containing protein [Dongiaceae bacterium]|nr:adenylate/guanylate cyclase domain-containing protein [Dongiaceae bacterium]